MRARLALLAALAAPFGSALATRVGGGGAHPASGGDRADAARVPDFTTDVLPLITRIGCNSGQCHGASGGQAGFALSLRGYDPVSDYDAIVRERGGRRVDLGDPGKSLILRKPSMQIAHKGGRKLPKDGERFDVVKRWIEAGAPWRTQPARTVTDFKIEPAARAAKPGDAYEIKAIATLDDGTTRDVTPLTQFATGLESVATVTPEGKVDVVGPGETAILVKYAGHARAARVSVPFGPPYEPRPSAKISNIDRLVEAKCAAMGIPLSPPADDATFLRRVTLDLAGRLPTIDEVRGYLTDGPAERRENAINRLLRSKEFAAHWARWFADLARVRVETMQKEGAAALHGMLRQMIANRRPVAAIVRRLVLGVGDPKTDGAAAFALATLGPKEQMEHVTRTFLGIRLACAQCHAHPFDRWTRDDYYGAASFFARVVLNEENNTIFLESFGELTDPRTGGDASAKFPGGERIDVSAIEDRREPFVDWMLDPKAMRFQRAMANRIWKQLFGRGIVEPVDDLRDANPPSNPELLDELANVLRNAPGDLVGILAVLVRTDAYGRSTASVPGNERDMRYASRALPRPLPAAVALDAIADSIGVTLEFPDDPRAKRAIDVADEDGGSYSMRVLGTCPRDGTRDPSTIPPPTVPAALHLLHGPPAQEWIQGEHGRVASILARKLGTDAAISELFVVTLGRGPTADEAARARKEIGATPTREGLANVLWALLATTEFAFNH